MSSEETHHKMSKKIAQLTKVIFHLHSKNEENSQVQLAHSNAYEKEIEQLLVAANQVIAKQKDALAKAEQGAQWKDKIAALEAKHLEERKQSQGAFSGYQQMINDKEEQLERDHQEKVQEMRTQVADIKKGFENRCAEFKK